ncbi:hypothetical protein ACFLTH_08020 [Bacteroidota bacterium]
MLLKVAIKKLEESKEFKEFKKENPEFYLAHAFTIIDKIQTDWQIGYFGNKHEKVVVFMVGKEISQSAEEEVFKKPEDRVKKLDMNNVKIDLEKAFEICEKLLEEKYKGEIINKTIAILQNLETELYNITLVCQSMNLINVKIDANNEKILHESRESIMGLKKE